ncbi:hypothetical protein B0T16DRAFT_456154 [Cercophora newfieldiana]|uniref:Uncharacterized protein n=1 Tax=Cercophora newfieldiana TaxID=92897 RepID=A0AA40CRG8_9PEZI|nr:hypothetical protein B0T16DRAFT_456154 [Cercophora newfieldiana]
MTTTTTLGPSWAGALTTVSTLPCTSYMWGDDFSEPTQCRIPFFSYANFIGSTSRKYFSPGICFAGWTVGCDFPGPRDTGIPETVTRKLCVPSGFECCGPSSAVTTVACNTTAVAASIYTWQPAFEIRWAEGEVGQFQTHPMTPGLVLGVGSGSMTTSSKGVGRRAGAVAPQPDIHARRQELHSYEHKPEELPNREYIWGPALGKPEVVELMTPEPVYELETGPQGLRPPPSPGMARPT